MVKKMIAIIPARGGSKGLPGKNIRMLCGKPLIQYTVEAALESNAIDRVIVTTDDTAIAEAAITAGAEVPFMRPEVLASDKASAVDVYIHAAEFLKGVGCEINKFMVLLPTAPLRSSKHINEAYSLFCKKNADTLISVKEADNPPTWFLEMKDNQRIKNAGFGPREGIVSNRQNCNPFYVPNGAIYILDYKLLKEKRTYYSDNTIGYLMGKLESVDIDSIDDFEYAEFLLSRNI